MTPAAHNLFVYDTNVTGTSSPTASQSTASDTVAAGAVIEATGAPRASITAVGSLDDASGYDQSTLSVDPQHVGDALVLGVAMGGL